MPCHLPPHRQNVGTCGDCSIPHFSILSSIHSFIHSFHRASSVSKASPCHACAENSPECVLVTLVTVSRPFLSLLLLLLSNLRSNSCCARSSFSSRTETKLSAASYIAALLKGVADLAVLRHDHTKLLRPLCPLPLPRAASQIVRMPSRVRSTGVRIHSVYFLNVRVRRRPREAAA